MDNLIRNFAYQGKNLFRDKGFIFWSLIYPLILAIFFNIAFSGLLEFKIETIDIGIEKDNPIFEILEGIDILNVNILEDEDISKKLEDKSIVAYIDKELNLKVQKSGLEESIIKEIVDEIKQASSLNVPFEKMDFNISYIDTKNQKSNSILIIFYSLIALVSVYSVFPGIETVSLIQANLSNVAQRINITPLKKREFLIAGILVGLSLNVLSNILLLIFLKYVLKLNLFTNFGYSALLIFFGNIFGVALGTFIGASNKQSSNVKTIISIAITLTLSFIAGMINVDLKNLIEKKIPFIKDINPITIITDNLYKINFLNITDDLFKGLFNLSIICLILISLSYVFIRRKTYDSL